MEWLIESEKDEFIIVPSTTSEYVDGITEWKNYWTITVPETVDGMGIHRCTSHRHSQGPYWKFRESRTNEVIKLLGLAVAVVKEINLVISYVQNIPVFRIFDPTHLLWIIESLVFDFKTGRQHIRDHHIFNFGAFCIWQREFHNDQIALLNISET